ncbi:hypothetical protein AUJ17_01950 [Candidatus Micrarchaeota archaeon CG1_02_47_40]|nr:MAG: hypothetical protein AUJ17_01950 [Candidatus Micrarchaeota archaeon CG1_02_47_40]
MDRKLILAGVLFSFALVLAAGAVVYFSIPQAQEEPQAEVLGENTSSSLQMPFTNITIIPKNKTKPVQTPSLLPANLTSGTLPTNTTNATNATSPSGGSGSGGGSSSGGGGSSGGGSSGGSEPPVWGSGSEPSAEIAPTNGTTETPPITNITNETNKTYYYPLMSAAIAEAKCRVDFALAVLKATREEEVHAGYSALLYQDITHLEAYAQQNDIHAFNGYRGSQFVDHMKNLWNEVRQAKANRNYTLEEKDLLRVEYKNAEDAYMVCHVGAIGSYANAKVSLYEHILDEYSAKVENLKNKVNTTHLIDLLKDARERVINPLKKKFTCNDEINVNSSTQTANMCIAPDPAELEKYCLFEECTAEGAVNFHFSEKYNIEKMGAIMEALQEKAYSAQLDPSKAKNVRDSLVQMRTHLQNAKNAVDSAGDLEMTEEQKKTVANYLLQAQGLAKELLGILKTA